jgi:hypothetical protein
VSQRVVSTGVDSPIYDSDISGLGYTLVQLVAKFTDNPTILVIVNIAVQKFKELPTFTLLAGSGVPLGKEHS